MDNEELKKKIIDVLRDNREYELRYYPDDNYTEVVIDYEAIADALIAAGLKFDRNISYTATFNLAQLERINDLEKRIAKAEHRAARAERALVNTCAILYAQGVEYPYSDEEWQLQQAEKELAEEKKDAN